MKPSPIKRPDPNVNKSIDFLKEQRIKRNQQEHDNEGLFSQKNRKYTEAMVHKYLNDPNMTEVEKLEEIKRRAE